MRKKYLLLLSIPALAFTMLSLPKENKQDLLLKAEDINNKGLSIKKALNKDEEASVGKTYVQHGSNGNNRMVRFATPVKGDVTKLQYRVNIEGYEDTTFDVKTIYKAVEGSNNENNYYNGTEVVKEESEATSSWYWACFTIEYTSYKYFNANLSGYLICNEKINSEVKENISLTSLLNLPSISSEVIGKWKNDNYNLEITQDSLILNEVTYHYVDNRDKYIFASGLDYLEVTYVDSTFTLNGYINEQKISETLISADEKVLEDLHIEFDYQAGETFYKGIAPTFKILNENDEEVTDADVTIRYTSDTTGYNSDKLPTDAGDYCLDVIVNKDDKYSYVTANRWFRVSANIKTTLSSSIEKIYEGSLENLIDGDESTYCWFGEVPEEGKYIEINYSYPQKINTLNYLFASGDYSKFKIQYLNENNEYEFVSDEIDGAKGVVNFTKTVTTKSLRLVVTANRGVWFKVFELNYFFAPTLKNNGFTFVESYADNNFSNLNDNNLNTYTWFDWHYTSDCNLILDYEEIVDLKNIVLLSGCDDHPYDFFNKDANVEVKFSYSSDGETYVDIDGTYSGKNIYVDLTDKDIEARYIKVTPILEGQAGSGVAIREFGINKNPYNVTITFSDETNFVLNSETIESTISLTHSYSIKEDLKITYDSEDNGLYGLDKPTVIGT